MGADRSDLTQLLSDLFSELVSGAMTRDVLEELTGPEVTVPLYHVMLYVFRHPDCSVRQIAESQSITLPAGSQFVDRLVKKNLALRSEGVEDRRFSRIRLTERGNQMVRQIHETRSARLKSILDKMDPNRRVALADGLQEFISWALRDWKSPNEICLHCGTEHNPCCVVNMTHISRTGMPIEST